MRNQPRRRRRARVVTLLVTGALAIAAVSMEPRSPGMLLSGAELSLRPLDVPPPFQWRTDTLRRGETLSQLLERAGIARLHAREALLAATALDERRVPAGLEVTTKQETVDAIPVEITLHLAVDHLLRLSHDGQAWEQTNLRLPWVTDTIVVAGEITSSLSAAIDRSAGDLLTRRARSELTYSLADIYEYRVDMSRDLHRGDRFRALVVRQSGPAGAVRLGQVLAARFELSGKAVEAVRFGDGRNDFYDQEGKSMRAAFLRAPLEFRRISSNFGMRRHPILGTMRQHAGLDYSAASGTPVRAIGDGTVIFAGWRGGYGNTLEIRHRNGFVTRYAHLRGFAKGVRSGTRVRIAETVAYVGSTGLSTAPHLHFEVLVNGKHRDPRVALDTKSGLPLEASQRARFAEQRRSLVAALDRESRGPADLAMVE